MMKRSIRAILEGDVPDDAPEWIAEMQYDTDVRDLTPLQVARRAAAQMHEGHCWVVVHVRSGLQWSVCLGRNEVVEIAPHKNPGED